MEMEISEDFCHKVKSALSEGNTSNILFLFKDDAYSSEIEKNAWDLIPIIIEYLTKKNSVAKPEIFNCCIQMLDIVVDKSNSAETLFQLIGAVESAKDDVIFFSLLKPLWKVLTNCPKQRLHSLAWCFNAVNIRLTEMEIPDNFNLNDEERLLMDADPITERIICVYSELLPFYDKFIDEIQKARGVEVSDRKRVLCKFLTQLLGHPLAYLDMRVLETKHFSKARRISENIIYKIAKLKQDPFVLLEVMEDQHDSELYKPNSIALGVLFYLILVEKINEDAFPKVYDPIYLFQDMLHLVSELLTYDNQFIIEKALLLMDYLLIRVKHIKLTYRLLDSSEHCKFCKKLSNVIIYNQLQSLRKFGLRVFSTYLHAFEIRGRYLIICNLMKILNHTGLISYIITQYKNIVTDEFKCNENNISEYCKGVRLFNLLKLFSHLPKREETDLIEIADQILATINLLRYLALRDKANITGICNYFTILENDYFEPLKRGIMLSREHYEFKIKELKAEKAKGDEKDFDSNVSITVAGKDLPGVTTNEKLNILLSSITSFDVMESLLSRLKECIEMRQYTITT